MKRLALVLVFAAAFLPGAAQGAACSPLNCAPSQFTLGGGALLGFRTAANAPVTVVDLRTGETRWSLPDGISNGNLLVHQADQAGRKLVWYDASRGVRLYAVTFTKNWRLVGVSQNGTRAVGLRLVKNGTDLVVASQQVKRTIHVPGRQWDFDALRGDNLFLIRYVQTGGYQVRLVHVGSGRLEAKPLKDPHESGTIWGSPFSRLSSADGRYLFTLYIGSNGGAMVHELNLKTAKARCIDLPGAGDYGSATSWAFTLSKDERTLWAVNPGYGRVVAIDVASRKVSSAFRIVLPLWNRGNGTSAALSPDGGHIAIADGETVAIVDLTARRVTKRDSAKAIALGYSPDGSQLWKLS
jgi:hypothetical protein